MSLYTKGEIEMKLTIIDPLVLPQQLENYSNV